MNLRTKLTLIRLLFSFFLVYLVLTLVLGIAAIVFGVGIRAIDFLLFLGNIVGLAGSLYTIRASKHLPYYRKTLGLIGWVGAIINGYYVVDFFL